jgi:hypothetical protein
MPDGWTGASGRGMYSERGPPEGVDSAYFAPVPEIREGRTGNRPPAASGGVLYYGV